MPLCQSKQLGRFYLFCVRLRLREGFSVWKSLNTTSAGQLRVWCTDRQPGRHPGASQGRTVPGSTPAPQTGKAPGELFSACPHFARFWVSRPFRLLCSSHTGLGTAPGLLCLPCPSVQDAFSLSSPGKTCAFSSILQGSALPAPRPASPSVSLPFPHPRGTSVTV